jgi:hypothetical protein
VQHDPTPPPYNERPDLELLYSQGATLANDPLVDLFCDACWRYLGDLRPDGSYRDAESADRASERQLAEQLSAMIAGAASTFEVRARQILAATHDDEQEGS